jgi:hypothetical protein
MKVLRVLCLLVGIAAMLGPTFAFADGGPMPTKGPHVAVNLR